MNYCISDTGLRSLLITSDSILLHRAAYGLRATACCRANSLPSAAAFSKSALASSSWHANLRKRPLCTSPWQAVLPVPPLREMARSRSSSAPERREEACEAHTFLESWLLICYVLQASQSGLEVSLPQYPLQVMEPDLPPLFWHLEYAVKFKVYLQSF